MMFKRMFSYDEYKGEKGYLMNQRKSELLRTIVYFALAMGIFLIGYFSTGTRNNLMTIIAILGLLPGSKSMVSLIMFFRYWGCDYEIANRITERMVGSDCLSSFDNVFTSYEKNYVIDHLVVSDHCILGYSPDPEFQETAFREHIKTILAAEHYENISVKIYTNIDKYLEKITSLASGSSDDAGIMKILHQVSL